ncbi:MAG: hypothetical protein Q4C82_07395 [Eubacteriales bacterium]|nr:hypothetical protein [Eubacteriales bacterium]
MCKVIEDMRNESFQEGYQLGIELGIKLGNELVIKLGIEQSQKILAVKLLNSGRSCEETAELLEVPVEKILEWKGETVPAV